MIDVFRKNWRNFIILKAGIDIDNKRNNKLDWRKIIVMELTKLTALLLGAVAFSAQAVEPENYYLSCEGKTGAALLSELCEVVGPHTTVSYDNLYTVYKTSDVHEDGSVWDMYSTKNWGKNYTKCGNYSAVGDCINREHSFPKSWFDKKKPMYSDAFHIYPTDGKVNGQRSSFPYGECVNGTTLTNGSIKGLGKLGKSTFPGYSGTVFEPDDKYKGDFARSYFYMAAAYNDKISTWKSDMLAGNSYPAFSSWALDLLLKWHRQDPVSQKELDRNEAVSIHQDNRNPFIDHPELVEYIWGNKQGVAWKIGAGNEPAIVSPVNSSDLDMGLSAVGVARTSAVTVKGSNLSEDVRVNVSGVGFAVSPSSLSASAVNSNEGANITISYIATTEGDGEGSLILRSGDLTTTVSLTCTAVDGLPAGQAMDISDESFTACWTCIDSPTSSYTLNVMLNDESIEGYPMTVVAGDEKAVVSGLQAETTYTYTVASSTLTSKSVTVTTAAPIPYVEFLYDGELDFVTLPGEPSDVAEILMIIENIPGEISISVDAPFEISTDKASWSTKVTLAQEEERFYLRLNGNTAGVYSSTVTVEADGYFYDDLTVEGVISSMVATFHEDFEQKGDASYNGKTYVGSACKWQTNAYFEYNGTNSYPHEGSQAARTPKSSGYIYMLESKPNGMGTITLWARLWKDETRTSKWDVMISDDEGVTWKKVGDVAIESNNSTTAYNEYTVVVNRKGALRMKLEQTEGGRTFFDDICITDCQTSGIEVANEAEYHSWDAFCRGGKLILESNGTSQDYASVYSVDGTERYSSLLPIGETSVDLAPGLYIVVVRDFSRRVVVR